MNKQGQASLESIIVLTVFFALFGVFLQAFELLAEESQEASHKTIALAESKKCAAIIDAIFANSGGNPRTLLHNCMPAAAHYIQANHSKHKKTAFTIAEKMEWVQEGTQTRLEVISPEHYQ